MRLTTLGVVAAAVFAATVSATPAVAAETPQWQLTLLPLPADSPNAIGDVYGADGHGGYAGELRTDAGHVIATWHDGQVVVHAAPGDGDPMVTAVRGESRDDTVLLSSSLGPVTLDREGAYHSVPAGSFTKLFVSAIGPNGDLVGTAADPADSSKTVVLYWPSPSDEPSVLAGVLPNSSEQAIDDDGTVLFNHPDGPYLLRQGVVRKLAAPAGYGYVHASSIHNGVVSGSASPLAGSGWSGIVWRSPDSPQLQEKSAGLRDANSQGLSVGQEYDPNAMSGPVAAWLDGNELGRLPAPDGGQVIVGRFVDEDGTIAGLVAVHQGGRPAVWRLVQG